MPVPVWQVLGDAGKAPQVLVMPAYNPGQEEDDILDQRLSAVHYAGVPVPHLLADADFASIVSDGLFGADHAPRFIVLVGLHEWLLLNRFKWPNSRALRFDWSEILDRKEPLTLQAVAALLHRDSLAPGSGASLLESLDENAHKHAFGVSADLKYAIREAIEVLGNEAVRQLRQQAVEARRGFFSGKDELDPEQLSLECLRLVYRLLFMFYIEARPELGYVPIRTSEIYLKGYSLESLRDREATEDPLPVWPAAETHASGSTRAVKEAIRKRGLFNDDGDLATPFRRLKLVTDYWCALWFWPIRGSGQLPSRE